MTQIRSMPQPVRAVPASSACIRSIISTSSCRTWPRPRSSTACSASTSRKRTASSRLYTHGHPHRWGVVSRRPAQEVHLRLVRRLRGGSCRASASGWRRCGSTGSTRPKASRSNGLWFRDPDGTLVEIRVAEKSSPNAKAAVRDEGRRRPALPTRRAAARRTQVRAAPARARAAVRHRHPEGRSPSIATCWACGSPTAPAT